MRSDQNNRETVIRARVKVSTRDQLRSAADKMDQPQSALIRLAIREYLERHNIDHGPNANLAVLKKDGIPNPGHALNIRKMVNYSR